MLICFCFVPMVGLIALFIWLMMLATSKAAESSPFGKIILAAGIFTWSHLIDGGLPPNSCAFVIVAVAVASSSIRVIILKPGKNFIIAVKIVIFRVCT